MKKRYHLKLTRITRSDLTSKAIVALLPIDLLPVGLLPTDHLPVGLLPVVLVPDPFILIPVVHAPVGLVPVVLAPVVLVPIMQNAIPAQQQEVILLLTLEIIYNMTYTNLTYNRKYTIARSTGATSRSKR